MKNYARYSGMAFELLALILIMVFAGKKLDAYFDNKKSFLTAALVVFGVIGYMVRLYYEITKKNNNEK
ncbi:MAG TPA: AtpZ/AtpI family protein [Bacteroidetes bacterium]|nr:AtpZ/AtpI family protein [Bacteroidota bacterium]